MPYVRHTRSGCSVTCHNQRLGALLVKKVGNDQATLDDKFGGFLAVRNVATVSQIQQGLVGQRLANFIEYGKPANAGIENPDWCIAAWVHRLAHRNIRHVRPAPSRAHTRYRQGRA
ncbi:H+/Cl- antiporter ClcA [Pseudomonas syringae pv. actinidiae]|uniref:H+/Cl- antiporter ClcA n=1 Tax=Pseudomonas syringae pv. actinidiae TaxID=103796 RepID=A0AAN4Q1H3_PSESF|nr:H+/Cl- antiporter ClcA [Pseudomonas syringae pv. actinidiae]